MKLLGWYDDVVLWPQCHVHHRSHHHVLYMHDAKLDFGRCMHAKQNAGTRNLSSCMNFMKISNQIGRAYGANIIWHVTIYTPLFAKFDAIFEQMPGELMVHKSS